MVALGLLDGVAAILLDTAPLIYAIERHPKYSERVRSAIGDALAHGTELIVTAVTLAECIAGAEPGSAETFAEFCLQNADVRFIALDGSLAIQAGSLRQATGLKLPDAFQLAAAVSANCDLIFTNDRELSTRQNGVRVLLVDDLVGEDPEVCSDPDDRPL